jgi:predicted molibdopterin-dependent oxidoreductase YjgC
MMLSSGNHNCAVPGSREEGWTEFQLKAHADEGGEDLCPAWGDCRLQDLAFQYQVQPAAYAPHDTVYPKELANPLIIRDFSRCILCGRCVQACNEIQVNRSRSAEKGAPSTRVA